MILNPRWNCRGPKVDLWPWKRATGPFQRGGRAWGAESFAQLHFNECKQPVCLGLAARAAQTGVTRGAGTGGDPRGWHRGSAGGIHTSECEAGRTVAVTDGVGPAQTAPETDGQNRGQEQTHCLWSLDFSQVTEQPSGDPGSLPRGGSKASGHPLGRGISPHLLSPAKSLSEMS